MFIDQEQAVYLERGLDEDRLSRSKSASVSALGSAASARDRPRYGLRQPLKLCPAVLFTLGFSWVWPGSGNAGLATSGDF